jgi:hypothetical protein
MHAERLDLCNGKRINTWKIKKQRHVQERVLVVVNLVDCLLVEFPPRLGSEERSSTFCQVPIYCPHIRKLP